MGSRDRPHREEKKKAKAGEPKAKQLQPFLEVPQNVEIVKPRRKPRTETHEEES